jgi:Fe-S oxidoreductase
MAGYAYRPTPDEDVCCGFGGTYSLDFPEISREILKNKLDALKSSGVRQVATDCPGCILQLQGGFDRLKRPVRVRHVAEWVEDTLKDR